MNLDAAHVLTYLRAERVPRQVRSIVKGLGMQEQRVRGALVLLEAVGKVKRSRHGGTWELT